MRRITPPHEAETIETPGCCYGWVWPTRGGLGWTGLKAGEFRTLREFDLADGARAWVRSNPRPVRYADVLAAEKQRLAS